MIHKNVVLLAMSGAGELSAKGVVADPRPGSVLASMVGITNTALSMASPIESYEDLDTYAAVVEASTSGDISKASAHDTAMDQTNVTLVNACREHLRFARSVVKPLVVQMAESTLNFMPAERQTPADKFTLVIEDLPELLVDPVFTETLKYYKEKTPIFPTELIELSQATPEVILGMMMTREKETDKDIVAWYTRMGDTFFMNIWSNLFENGRSGSTSVSSRITEESMNKSSPVEIANIALCIYLLAVKLSKDVHESAANIPLAVYQRRMWALRDYAGALMMQSINTCKRYSIQKVLVTKITAREFKANVYGPVYRDWVKAGGKADTIYSMIVSNSNKYLAANIDSEAEELAKHWRTYCLVFSANEVSTRLVYFKDSLRAAFRTLMMDVRPEEVDVIQSTSNYQIKVNDYFEKELKEIYPVDIEDIYGVALKLMCRSRFFYTDAEKILSGMINAAKMNPDINEREAALLATIDYAADYLTDQIILVEGVVKSAFVPQ